MRGPIAVALTTCVLLTAASMAWGEEPAPSITVIGSGAASAASDTAEVNAGVVTQAATASQAMSQNSAAMEQVLKALGRRSILTVGETKDFTSRSGMIGFEVSQRHLRLRINLGAAQEARLTISSKLLRQAEIVGTARSRRN